MIFTILKNLCWFFVFIPRVDLRHVRFKCTFTILNSQPAPRAGFPEIVDSRVWQTNIYDGVYFNDFIKTSFAQTILKRVIVNGVTGSSWRFKSLDRVCLAVNSDEIGSVGKQIKNLITKLTMQCLQVVMSNWFRHGIYWWQNKCSESEPFRLSPYER